MSKYTVNRRTLLRGIGGATLVLPPLEIMNGQGRARAAGDAGIPKRFCNMWAGVSLTGSDRITYDQFCLPTKPGTDWELTRGLTPLGGGPKWKSGQDSFTWQNLQQDVGVVSGMRIPIAPSEGAPASPGGLPFSGGVHGWSNAPQLTGTTPDQYYQPKGPTVDQVVGDTLGAGAQRRSIGLSVQPHVYGNGNEGDGPVSWDRNVSPKTLQASPVTAFKTVFDISKLATTDPATYDKLVRRRKSIIDLVRDNSAAMVARLGGQDKQRMQKYYDEIRGLETRLDRFKTDPTCQVPKIPAADPPEGGSFTQADVESFPDAFAADAALSAKCWSNETLRGELLTDVIALAFQCNITPVAFLRITTTKTFMGTKEFTGMASTMHGLTHTYEDAAGVADAVAWHVNMFARLVAKLKGIREIDGSALLDHTVLALMFEGGCGELNAQELTGSANKLGGRWAHSTDDMMVVYGGGSALGVQHQHIQCNNQKHPAEVLVTLMNAVGVKGPLGAINKTIPEMGVAALQ